MCACALSGIVWIAKRLCSAFKGVRSLCQTIEISILCTEILMIWCVHIDTVDTICTRLSCET
jgi:hypothetical protein